MEAVPRNAEGMLKLMGYDFYERDTSTRVMQRAGGGIFITLKRREQVFLSLVFYNLLALFIG